MIANLKYKNSIYIFLTTLIALVSCKEGDEIVDNFVGDENINISILGVQESSVDLQKEASVASLDINTGDLNENKIIEKFDDFSWTLSTEYDDSIIANRKSFLSKLGSTIPMQVAKKYMILFYEIDSDETSSEFIKSEQITVASSRHSLKLTKSKRYRWYAYSYNESSNLPLPSDINNPTIPTRDDAPFLFATGVLEPNTSTEENVGRNIDIIFFHKTNKVEVKLDARPYFASAVVVSAELLSPLQTHDFDFKTGVVTGNALTSVLNRTLNFVNDNNNPAVKISNNIYYTSESSSQLHIKFLSLQATVNGTSLALISSGSPKNALINTFVTTNGIIKRGVINIEKKNVVIGNTVWATGNLFYDAAAPEGEKYKFGTEITTRQSHSCNYYFNWNTLLPRAFTGTSYGTGDPCKKVFPENIWRTPTQTDYNNLISSTTRVYNSIGSVYFRKDASNGIYFHEAGEILSSGCSVTNTDDGQYWSSTSYSTSEAYILQIDGGGGALGNRVIERDKDEGKPIRCVKNL